MWSIQTFKLTLNEDCSMFPRQPSKDVCRQFPISNFMKKKMKVFKNVQPQTLQMRQQT